MQEPIQGIAPPLQGHIHLLSTYAFPSLTQLHPQKVSEWLLGAPKISRDQAPFYWTYLDRPSDGTILLVWQSPSMSPEYASDGYLFAPESSFRIEVTGGYTLEMYESKSGFGPGESVTTHARRRYRLLSSKFQNHAGPQPDPSLWIVHYFQADPNDRHNSQLIQLDHRMQTTMNTRAYLHQQGQIMRKEFMLHDRPNWPSIPFPGPPRGPSMYGASVPPTRVPQQMAYPPQHATPGPPAKRVRTGGAASQTAASSAVILDGDDEEDTSRGDLFDHMTPREISISRYKQNHEWMEEILSSPYSIHQIIPADLGLGMRGELHALTDGIFDAPFNPEKDVVKHEYVGRLDPEKADEFRKRVTAEIAETNKEIEKMKAKHAKRLAKLKKGSLITQAEKALRTAVSNPAETGPEYWRLEGKIDDEDIEEGKTVVKTTAKVSDIVAQVEASVSRHVAAVKELIRIQDGGYEEPAVIPSPPPAAQQTTLSPPNSHGSHHSSNHSGVLIGDGDMDMSNSAAGLLDQYHGASSNATPGSSAFTPQPHLQTYSSGNTPSNAHVPSPQPTGHAQSQLREVSGTDNMGQSSTPDATGTGDWVVVPPGGVSPTANPLQSSTSNPVLATGITTTATSSAPAISSASTHSIAHPSSASNADTPTTNLPDFHTSEEADFADLGDLDTAGDALAGYGDEGGDMGDLDMDVDGAMDDSAFGDAFHGVEPRGGEGDGDGLGDL